MENYSVLMSVYNGEKPEYLLQSIESIFSQTIPTNDFVLVCDGPLTEELNSLITEFEQKYEEKFNVVRFKNNRGLGPALNDGLRLCKNRLVARMDSDDIAPEYRCEMQLKAFSDEPQLSIVGGAIEEFACCTNNIISKKNMPLNHEDILNYSKKRCPFNHPTVMYDKDVVLANGGYPDILLHEDYALWVKLLQNGVISRNLPDNLCFMRVDSGLYGRRGGLNYLKIAYKFRWHLYRTGFCSFFQAIYTIFALTAVCLVPTSLREFIYKKVLRSE
ncbi:MAG: glycosyltransferase [Clostridia bacterium]|nr:glycosyltransferase [Clostridia bacterium]